MGASESKMTVDEFLKGDDKDPIADVASALSVEMTKAAINLKDAGVKAAGEAAKMGAEAAMGAAATAAAGTAAGAVAGAVAGPVGMVVGALATAILNGVWNAIFPPESTQVYPAIEEIRQALGQKLREDTISKINGLLSDLRTKLTIDYANSRKASDLTDKEARKRLYDELAALNSNLDGVIGTLMQRGYAKIGLVNFLLLAGLRLALYQEMANVDPQNKDPKFNPAKSRYATPEIGVVAEYARKYADHAEKCWEQILKDKKMSIKVTSWKEGGRLDDELTKEFQQDTNRSVSLLVDDFWGRQKRKLEEKFCHPKEIITHWRYLIKVPINIPHIPAIPAIPAIPNNPGQREERPAGWTGWVRGFVPGRTVAKDDQNKE